MTSHIGGAQDTSEAVLRVAGLVVRYGMVTALDGVSIEVDRGRIVTILGPNGAGKTTLLSTIAGIRRPAAGSMTFEGAALATGSPEKVLRSGIALVPEGRSIFGALTVEENLRLGGSVVSGAVVAEGLEWAFTQFPVLAERRNQAAGTLSGGEQQMLAIARALMSKPTVVLYDEPSLGLAPRVTAQMFDLIVELSETGVTTVLVEQNVHLALRISDYAYVLASGHVVGEGPAAEFTAEDFTALYLGEQAS